MWDFRHNLGQSLLFYKNRQSDLPKVTKISVIDISIQLSRMSLLFLPLNYSPAHLIMDTRNENFTTQRNFLLDDFEVEFSELKTYNNQIK